MDVRTMATVRPRRDTRCVGRGRRASRRCPPTHRPGRFAANTAPPAVRVVQAPKARTPARPDGAILKPPPPRRGGGFLLPRPLHARLAERGYATDGSVRTL